MKRLIQKFNNTALGHRVLNDSVFRLFVTANMSMVLLAIALSGIVCMGIVEKHNPRFHTIVMITIATYTFYIVIQAVISVVKAYRKKDAAVIMLRDISMAGAVGAVLSLQRSMLGTFGDPGNQFSMIMTVSSGAAAFLLVIAIGVSMMMQAGSISD